MTKIEAVQHILRNAKHNNFVNPNGGHAWAPANVALCKYWGKRDTELNLPMNSSLSISLGKKGTFTRILQLPEGEGERFLLNGKLLEQDSAFAVRLRKFLDLFRPTPEVQFFVDTRSTVPVAAGLASSASGFAALVQALNNLYDWQLDKTHLSILARLGSGSACRSLWDGFVEWEAGVASDGMDSYGKPLDLLWPDFCVGSLIVSATTKHISSTEAMRRTVATSPFYATWPEQAAEDLQDIKRALVEKDFIRLGKTAELNAMEMHAVMAAAKPPILYLQPDTLTLMQKVWDLKNKGIPVFFTEDAGPNLQLLFLAEYEEVVIKEFPSVDVIHPFSEIGAEQVILVDAKDVEIGVEEKISAHLRGQLHRAFSVFILRQKNGQQEVLLQQRHANKYHSGGLWSNTCCGHPRPGESVTVAAMRRLQEEMGFAVELRDVGSFKYRSEYVDIRMIEHEVDHVLVGIVDADKFCVDEKEVQDYKWMAWGELRQDLSQNPQNYTSWLPLAIQAILQFLHGVGA